MHRRQFLAASALAAAPAAFAAFAASSPAVAQADAGIVNFTHDGLNLGPREYAALLQRITTTRTLEPDNYSLGGEIAALERDFAQRLGKPAAMYVPTGTLANLLAVRGLAGGDRRVLVQAESHLHNDSGDGATALAGLTLVPLGEGRAMFTLDEVQRAVERTRGGRVAMQVGVISIETPVRRVDHTMADLTELDRVCAYARGQGIRLHLDGARLFNLPRHSGRSVREYAAAFDTAYVSLWKHFNGAGGAILAGETAFIEGLFHTRRMFGSALPQAWSQVATVLQHVATYEADYAAAWVAADTVFASLEGAGLCRVRRLPGGTCRVYVTSRGAAPETVVARAWERGIALATPRPGTDAIPVQINTSLLRRPADAIARDLRDAFAT